MSATQFTVRNRITNSLWFVPVVCLIAGVALALITIAVDRATDGGLLPVSLTGDPNAALAILSTTAASMVSLTALVLTITAVVVQLAMGQFSPRSVRPFLRDRPSQLAIGVFVGTFAHSVLALREVRSFGDTGSVPGVTITVSFFLILASVIVLVVYVHHIGNSLKVDSIIRSVGEETRELLEELYPERDSGARGPAPDQIVSDLAGFVLYIDHDALVRHASDADCRLEVLRPIGTFVPLGAPLVRVRDGGDALDRAAVLRCVEVGPERTMNRDAAFGLQTLVDIALRSLTDSYNDPTTANQAVDRIHDCLRLLVARNLGTSIELDEAGELRLTVPNLEWEDYVEIAFGALLRAAVNTPQVLDRLNEALHDLRAIAPRERQQVLDERIGCIEGVRAAVEA